MIHHVWGLFTHPDQEWQEIRGEEESISHMYLTHILILAAIPAISAYIGTTQVGWVVGGGDPVKLTQASALQMTVLTYLAMLAGVAVMGAFINWMARTYDANPSLTQCIVFAAYNATPLFIAGLAALYPHLWLGMIVGVAAISYTVYLLYVGIPTFMNIHKDEGFLFSSSVLAVGLVVLVAMIALSVILWGSGVGRNTPADVQRTHRTTGPRATAARFFLARRRACLILHPGRAVVPTPAPALLSPA